jgi:hypothetical protein
MRAPVIARPNLILTLPCACSSLQGWFLIDFISVMPMAFDVLPALYPSGDLGGLHSYLGLRVVQPSLDLT